MAQVSKINNEKAPGTFDEIGVHGYSIISGMINEAYINELRWPQVAPIYSKMWRSDPEIGIARLMLESMASNVEITVEEPEDASDDDKRAVEFVHTEFENVDGGIDNFKQKAISTVPFFGWGFWEVVPGLRKDGWRPPDKGDEWRSQYDDGLIGARRLAWRTYSSFDRWEHDDKGRVHAMKQIDERGTTAVIPTSRAIHLRFGDLDNPEGLASMEALYRLERIKYGLEVVFGIGSEHSAGYLSASFEKEQPGENDKANIKKAARAILTAQEGNYAVWPPGVKAELMDTDFTAGSVLLEAIRYYGILKLQLMQMQWVAMATTSGSGAYSALQDSSSLSVTTFNAIMESLFKQVNQQYIRWLFRVNASAFPNLTRLPKLTVSKARKNIDLQVIGDFLEKYKTNVGPFSEGDVLNIRRQSDVLEEVLPNKDTTYEAGTQEPAPEIPQGDGEEDAEEDVEMTISGAWRKAMGIMRERYPKAYKVLNGRSND